MPVSSLHGGRGDIFPQVERALEGHAVGDRVEVTLAPDEAFGPHRPELTFTDDLANAPAEVRQLGAEVEMHNDLGETKTFVVSRIEDGRLTLDGNHPLAGKTITFKVIVTDIRDATGEEARRGVPAGTPQLH
jgi:FKBP-type peptidyl-prolyl cis-trans isomerase SlyD